MGTWGSGLWDNDTACDYLGNIFDTLKRNVVADLEAAKSDHILERVTPAAITIMRVLSSRLQFEHPLIAKKDVLQWREEYRRWFTTHFDIGGDDRDRWEAVDKEFATLATLADANSENMEDELPIPEGMGE